MELEKKQLAKRLTLSLFCTKCTAKELSEDGLIDINEKAVVMKRIKIPQRK